MKLIILICVAYKEGNENDSLYVLYATHMTNLTFEECLLKNMNIFFRRVI